MPEQQFEEKIFANPLESTEITIVKNEPGIVASDDGDNPDDEEFEYETNPSMNDEDEPIANYCVSPRLMRNLQAFQPTKFNKMNEKAEIIFTAAEVNDRIFSEGEPPVWRLLPKNHAPVPGKIPYSELLCERISAIMPNKSPIAVHNGFNTTGDTTRAYVRCKHSIKMPAVFEQTKLQKNKPLKIKIIQKCQDCINEAEDQVAATAPSATSSTSGLNRFESIFRLPNLITKTFEYASKDIHGILNRSYHLCSAERNPLKELQDRHKIIENEIVQAWRIQVGKIIGLTQEPQQQVNGENTRDSYKEEESDAFKDMMTKRTRQSTGQGQLNVSKRQKW